MTHQEYLEQHHEIVTGVLPAISMKHAQAEHEAAIDLLTRLRTRLDSLWEERRATAERETNP